MPFQLLTSYSHPMIDSFILWTFYNFLPLFSYEHVTSNRAHWAQNKLCFLESFLEPWYPQPTCHFIVPTHQSHGSMWIWKRISFLYVPTHNHNSVHVHRSCCCNYLAVCSVLAHSTVNHDSLGSVTRSECCNSTALQQQKSVCFFPCQRLVIPTRWHTAVSLSNELSRSRSKNAASYISTAKCVSTYRKAFNCDTNERYLAHLRALIFLAMGKACDA